MQQTAVEIHDLVKSFRKTAPKVGDASSGVDQPRKRWLRRQQKGKLVRVIDIPFLEVHRREIYGVLGPNGSGKSTLIRILSTLLLPDQGTARIFGHDVVRDPLNVQRLLNRVSAEASFFKKLSAMENLLHTSRLYGFSARQSVPRIREILKRLDLPKDKMDAEMHELSRGMQQKVALARAFLTSPVLMLLDEPTTGLDLKSRKEVQSFILEIRDKHDATVLLTTHDMLEAEMLCDRIAILDGGKAIAVGTADELKARAAARAPEPTAILVGHGIAPEGAGTLQQSPAGPSPNPAHRPSLEEAFLALTGHTMESAEQQEE